jgi:transposase
MPHYKLPFREAAVKLYHFFGNMKVTANVLGIGVATIWRWLNGYLHPKKREYKPYKLTNAILDFLKCLVSKHPTLSQVEMSEKLKETFGIYFSRQCIKCALTKLGFSRKKISKRGIVNKETHDKRLQEFRNNFNGDLIAVDEVGFDFRVAPTYGYSKSGTKCVVKSLSKKRQRLSMILAIDQKGAYFYHFHKTTVKSNHFENFIASLPWKNHKIVLDNASIHKTRIVVSASQNALVFTPPYTPECNPIENVFSVVKHYFRKLIVQNPEMDYQTQIISIMKSINPCNLFDSCFRNTRTFLGL